MNIKNTEHKQVTFILTQSLECPSGGGRYWPLARSLSARGYEVKVLALHPDFSSLTYHQFKRDDVSIHYVGQMHVQKVGSQKHYFNTLHFMWVVAFSTLKLTWAAVKSQSDTYHIAKAQPMNGVTGLVLQALGRRVYLDCDDFEAQSNRFSADWQKKIVAWFEDRLPSWVHGITVNTCFLQMRVRSLVADEKKVILVPNAASTEFLRTPTAEAVAEIKRQYQLEDRPVVIYVGSMNLANHPIDLLLKSFAQVIEEVPQAVLLLVGGGADLACLESYAIKLGIEQHLHFVGRVLTEDLPAYYAAADISVDPVLNDETAKARSPLKLYESLSVGTPVVTGDIGDRRHILGDNELMLVTAGDADTLARRLSALLCDETARSALKNWAVENREKFLWENRIDKFVRIYERI